MMLMRNDRVFGAIGSMVVWAAYFVAVYALQGLGCAQRWHEAAFAGSNALTAALVALTLVALVLIGWNGWRGWQGARAAAAAATGRAADAAHRHHFLGLLMLWLAGLSAFATVLVAVPVIMLQPCAA